MLSNVTKNAHLKLDRIAALCVVSSEISSFLSRILVLAQRPVFLY